MTQNEAGVFIAIVVVALIVLAEAVDRMQAADWHRRAARARELAFQQHAREAIDVTRNPDFDLWTKELTP